MEESVLRYENGVHWRMDPERLQIGQYIGGPFQEDYPIYKPAEAYLSNVSVPYQTLRLCYSASIKQENPTSWIAQRFLPSWLGDESEPKVFATIPTLFFEAVDALCQAEIRVGEYRDPTGESDLKSWLSSTAPLNMMSRWMPRLFEKPLAIGQKSRRSSFPYWIGF